MNEEEKDGPILIRVKNGGNTTVKPSDPDEAQYLYVDDNEQKKYAEYLRDEKEVGYVTIRTYLDGMKQFQKYQEKVKQQDE